jgi:peptide/nickel transport system substrate-binding protein
MNILRGSPNGLDPVLIQSKHADDIASQIFDKLVDLNEKLDLVPELARSLPTISDDGRIYTFHLRTDVSFHDNPAFPGGKGRRMTARDVKYSFERCVDPRTKTVAAWAFKDKVVGAAEYYEAINRAGTGGTALDTAASADAGVSGFRVLDDSTFQIELKAPYAPFIFYLVNSLGSVVPREAVEKYKEDFFKNPVGTGPFTFVSWAPDQELVLRRNPAYWGTDVDGNRMPFLDEVHFRFIKDDKVQFTEFNNGSLDEVFGIPTELFDDVYDPATKKAKAGYEKYQTQVVPAMLSWFFDFNTTKAPFDNRDVRRAFSFAIDREKLVRYVLLGSPYGPAIHGIVPPVFPNYPIDSVPGFTFNPAEAKKLLAAAGYPDGKGFPAVTLHIYPEPRLTQVAEAVQAMLGSTLGVKVSLQTLEFPQLTQQAEAGQLLFWGARWYGDYPDVETFLNLFNGEVIPTSDTMPSYPNSTRYNNPAFNQAFNNGVRTVDFTARMNYYLQAERIAVADAPSIPLFYENHYRLLQPNVQGNPLDPMARVDLKLVWFTE